MISSNRSIRRSAWKLIPVLIVVVTGFQARTASADGELDLLIREYLTARGTDVLLAPNAQLARRYAVDFTGVLPTPADMQAVKGMDAGEMFDHFTAKGAMGHTNGEAAYVWSNLLKDADHFLFSNSTQFSQIAHILEYKTQLRRVYAEGLSYKEFVTWALESQMFLNRFPSGADRANASFFLFLGRDSLSNEVPYGNMWNGYRLVDQNAQPGDANYHVYIYDETVCSSGQMMCEAELWGERGSTPAEAIDIVLSSHMFAEATVDHYWTRLMGAPLPGNDFPEIRSVLVDGFVAQNYDVNWLIREIATSVAYTQEMMFR
jgi:hypothetical protein